VLAQAQERASVLAQAQAAVSVREAASELVAAQALALDQVSELERAWESEVVVQAACCRNRVHQRAQPRGAGKPDAAEWLLPVRRTHPLAPDMTETLP
jgi:hypothetical protein